MKASNMGKYVAYFFLGSIALVVFLVMLAFSPIGVSTLVSFANKQEGIAISYVSGSFYSQVTVGKLTIDQPQIKINGEQISIDIGLNCLFVGEACIDQFSARNLEITLLENEVESDPSAPMTDYIELPVAAMLERFSIDKLSVFSKAIDAKRQVLAEFVKINANVSMYKVLKVNTLSIDAVTVFAPVVDPTLVAKPIQNTSNTEHWITLLKAYKFQAIDIPKVFVPINAELERIAVGKFCIEQAQVMCTLQTKLSASIRQQVVNATFVSKPEKQLASSIDLKAKLDLANAYAHSITATVLPNAALSSKKAQMLVLKASGELSKTELVLWSGSQSNIILNMTAKADLSQQQLPLNIELNANKFAPVLNDWVPSVEVPINAISFNIFGNVDSYKVNATAQVKSEQASKISLVGELFLSDKRLEFSEFSTSGDLGKLNARILARITQFNGVEGVNLDSAIGFENVQLKPLVPSLDSELNGSISFNASITPKQLWGGLICSEIKGKLQGLDLAFICDVKVDKNGLVNVKSFTLKQGKNQIKGKGQFELPNGLNTSELVSTTSDTTINDWVNHTKSALDLNIDINDLSSFYPPATGTIKGNARIVGKVDKPIVNARFKIDKLAVNEIKLKSAELDIGLDINKNWQTTITLRANELWQESLLAQQVVFDVTGDMASHKIAFNLQHPEYSLSHEINGEVITSENDWRWSGIWEKGLVALAFDSFILEKPTDIKANKTSASIKQHCWVSSQTSVSTSNIDAGNKALCIEKVQYSESLTQISANIAYNLKVPLLHFFPDIISVKSNLPLKTEIDLIYSPEKGVELDTYSLITEANIASSKHNIELVALVANSSLRNQILQTNIFAGTKSTGAIGLRSSLNLDPENRTHKGQFQINNLLLSPLQRFLPSVEKLTGQVVGNINFDGLLVEPDLNGELNINDVELVIDNYPYPITNFNQKIIIANRQAEIEGELELGSGTADYSGILSLFKDGQDFDFKGELIGAGMQLAFGKNELLASPSLKIEVNPSKFSLKGEVTIPNAQISIDKLPESAKSPSSDTIIIGKQAEPPIVPFGLDINVRVLLDPAKLKRVTINALDLQASLGGDVRVQVVQKQDPQTKEFSPLETYVYGSINVLKGSYEAYGQNLQIKQGSIYFNGAPSLPQFDITAVRNPLNTADNVVAGLRISGNPVVPKVELFSQPNMIQARQLSYLLQGTDLDGGAGTAQDVFLVNALVNFGVGNSGNGINKFGKSIGFESLNIQTAGQGTNTQVQLTGRISDNIQVSYGVGLFDQASEVILRYQLMPQLYLEAKRGATVAVDLFYEWTRGE